METWMWIGAGLLLGAAIGALAALWVVRRRWAEAARAQALRREFDDYKREVGDHFVETAQLVNDLTRSYKAVYDHLEHGAYRLVGEETLRKQLGNVDSESVKLEYIGRRDRSAVLGAGGRAHRADAAPTPDGTAASYSPVVAGAPEQRDRQSEPEESETGKPDGDSGANPSATPGKEEPTVR